MEPGASPCVEHPPHRCDRILFGCEVALPIIDQFVTIPHGKFATLTGGALISRLVDQENLKGDTDTDQ